MFNSNKFITYQSFKGLSGYFFSKEFAFGRGTYANPRPRLAVLLLFFVWGRYAGIDAGWKL